MLNSVSSDSLINVIPTELKDHLKLAKEVQQEAPEQKDKTEERPESAGPWTANFSNADPDEKFIHAAASPNKNKRHAAAPPPA